MNEQMGPRDRLLVASSGGDGTAAALAAASAGMTAGFPVGAHPHVFPFEGGLDRIEFTLH